VIFTEQETTHIIVELIEYEHDAVVSKSIMKKATGSINALSFASGEGLPLLRRVWPWACA
jgi:hypothetical protein